VPQIEDDEIRRRAAVACWHLRGALERLDQRAVATSNAEQRLAEARAAAERRSDRLLAVDLNGFDPHGYFVYNLWGEDETTPLYVGRSSNVLARLGSHLGEQAKWIAVWHVSVQRCPTVREMEALEKRLIRQLRPPWNKAGVPVSPSSQDHLIYLTFT
jgi:hypothetical protein